jgi:hypothetical protein
MALEHQENGVGRREGLARRRVAMRREIEGQKFPQLPTSVVGNPRNEEGFASPAKRT